MNASARAARVAETAEAMANAPEDHLLDIGDVTIPPPDPLTPPEGFDVVADDGGDVVYNHTLARHPEGARCIIVMGGTDNLTPYEAARLGRDLIDTAKLAGDQRQLRGYRP
jgi:hypothetical protein